MAQATRDTTSHRHPPHVQIWEHPERAPKIKKLGGTVDGALPRPHHARIERVATGGPGHVQQGLAGLPAPRRSGGGSP
jgi:hypothetical protein